LALDGYPADAEVVAAVARVPGDAAAGLSGDWVLWTVWRRNLIAVLAAGIEFQHVPALPLGPATSSRAIKTNVAHRSTLSERV